MNVSVLHLVFEPAPSKKRTHSLFRQGAMLYELIPMMPEPRLRPLVERFGAMLLEIPVFDAVYGII